MNNWKYYFILLLCFMICGCNSQATGDQWYNKTNQLLIESHNNDGGFNLLTKEKDMSLYDTFYNLKMITKYGGRIPNGNKLIKTTNKLLESKLTIDNKGTGNIQELYFLTGINKAAGTKSNEIMNQKIVEYVLKNRSNKDGFFRLSRNEDILSLISDTEQSLVILSNISYKYEDPVLLNQIYQLYKRQDELVLLAKEFKWTVIDSLINIEKLIKGDIPYFYNSGPGNQYKKQIITEILENIEETPRAEVDIINYLSMANILYELGHNFTLKKEVLNYIKSKELESGGYDFLNEGYPNSKASFEVYDTFFQDVPKKYLNELLKYQLSDGFFTYRNEHPSNFQSTYMALKILSITGGTIPENVTKYIQKDPKITRQKDLYYLNSSRRLLEMEMYVPAFFFDINFSALEKSEQIYFINNYFMITKQSIPENRLVYQDKIREIVKSLDELSFDEIDLLAEMSFGIMPEIRDLWVELPINQSTDIKKLYLKLLDLHVRNKTIDSKLLEQLNNYKLIEGGYKYFDDNVTPSLEATYIGLKSQMLLHQ
ncbi:hypothetical protein [Paenibacillus sp. GYB003]|uniref:hypothetical protein n=1 Tax=Paenibacillus sp. GYB003 TaxID=2994392 RepID=UPI002F96BC1A